MTTTENLPRTSPAFPEYLPHIVPFGSPWTATYDAIVTGPTSAEAMSLDRALRGLVTYMPGRIHAIMAFRDLLAVGGIRVGLRESKETIDAMIARIESERV